MSQVLLRNDPAPQAPQVFLSPERFAQIAAVVGNHTGIKLPPTKRVMVEGRLRKRMRKLDFASLEDYCRFLFEENGLANEHIHLINAVTTNKTDFFRESEHFDHLAKELLPSLLGQRSPGTKPKLKLWSAASSNGAEIYTISMVLADLAERDRAFDFAVLGTDISTEMLAAAERAVYPAEMTAPVPRHFQERYIMRSKAPSLAGKVRMAPELRRHVQFQHLNLMDETYPIDRDVDVIFLRNVLIYFEKSTQEAVVLRLLDHLRPGGYLLLGHSESMIGTNLGLHQLAPAVFQRV